MLSQIIPGHPEDDAIEEYAMNRLAEGDLPTLEAHLLVCQACQIRLTELDDLIAATRSTVRSFLLRGPGPGLSHRPFKKNVFISYGGPSITHVEAVCDLLNALGLKPVVTIDMPNLGLSVQDKVRKCMRICRSAVVLATSDEEAPQAARTRRNVEHEVGMLQTMANIGNRIVYMKDPNVQFPSNFREKAWIPFDRDRITESFVPLIKELRALAF
jgi:predicted nucleotide-binding protein with TIR-like domain